MLHKLNAENNHVSLFPDIPADQVAHQLSDSIVNSQSFFYGNFKPQQRARMRRDFNQNLMPVLQKNLGQTPDQNQVTAQIDQIQTNLLKYCHADDLAQLNRVIDNPAWLAALQNVVEKSYQTNNLRPAIKNLKQQMGFYSLQRDMIKASFAKFRSMLWLWGGIGIAVVLSATFLALKLL